jgi:hypothetical protein
MHFRLNVLLHEACHAYLDANTCLYCPSDDHCLGFDGHGRAFQLLSSRLEEKGPQFLGYYCWLCRFASMMHHIYCTGNFPNACDFDSYDFSLYLRAEAEENAQNERRKAEKEKKAEEKKRAETEDAQRAHRRLRLHFRCMDFVVWQKGLLSTHLL